MLVILGVIVVSGVRGELPVQKMSQALAVATEEVTSDGQYRLVLRPPVGMFGWCSTEYGAAVKEAFERRHSNLRFGDVVVESCVVTLRIAARPR